MLLPIFEPVVALFRPSETASHGNRGMMGLRGDVCVNQFYSTFSNFLLLYTGNNRFRSQFVDFWPRGLKTRVDSRL